MAAEIPERLPDHIDVGRITGVHGLTGQVQVIVMSDVSHRFDPGEVLYVDGAPLSIASSTPLRSGQIILSFLEVTSSKEAQRLVGHYVTVPSSEAPELPDGEYFHFQLLGLRVVTETGETLGEITEILETGSNDVYIVHGLGGEVLIPALSGVITDIRLEEGVMLVALPEGIR
ncbi:MAG: 16S rRNA processing protein RimM [SAR202 cluster bacterium Io17-Chloro-G9]|nr:MAG: 16S rRNA processing protein RimM [SAR202 cluster bacterium Io17-Chloro-G9]